MSLKPHEKILRSLQVNPHTERTVTTLLGLSELDAIDEDTFGAEKVDIREDFALHLTLGDYLTLRKPKVNKVSTSVAGLWGNKDGISTIINQDEYAEALGVAVDNILPIATGNDGLVPMTIFLPNAVKMDGDKLEGTESNWKFTQILNESNGEYFGLQAIFEQESLLYGAKILSALNSLGAASIKRSERNNSDFFSNLVQSTPLYSQFEYLDSKVVQKWKQLQKQLEEERKKIEKIERKIEKNNRMIFKSSDRNSPKISAIIDENKRLKHELKEAVAFQNNKMNDDELEDDDLVTSSLSNDFYFAIPEEILETFSINTDSTERAILLPSLRLKERESYQVTSVNVEKGNVAKWSTKRLRYMLSYLFPMTSGHAITLWIKPEANKVTVNSTNLINAPTLILPSAWMGLVNELKQHSPKKETPDYDELEEEEVKGVYKSALYGDFWVKRRELLRAIPEISQTTMCD